MMPFLESCYHTTRCQILHNRYQCYPILPPDDCVPMRLPTCDGVIQPGLLSSNCRSWGAQSKQGSDWLHKRYGEKGNHREHVGYCSTSDMSSKGGTLQPHD